MGLRSIRQHFGRHIVGYIALFFALGGSAGVAVAAITPQVVLDANHVFGYSNTNFKFNSVACEGGTACEWKSETSHDDPAFPDPGPLTAWRDSSGTIHLSGFVCYAPRFLFQAPGSGECSFENDGNDTVVKVATLPAGYRPAHNQYVDAGLRAGAGAYIAISTAGNIFVHGADYVSFDGISFRNG